MMEVLFLRPWLSSLLKILGVVFVTVALTSCCKEVPDISGKWRWHESVITIHEDTPLCEVPATCKKNRHCAIDDDNCLDDPQPKVVYIPLCGKMFGYCKGYIDINQNGDDLTFSIYHPTDETGSKFNCGARTTYIQMTGKGKIYENGFVEISATTLVEKEDKESGLVKNCASSFTAMGSYNRETKTMQWQAISNPKSTLQDKPCIACITGHVVHAGFVFLEKVSIEKQLSTHQQIDRNVEPSTTPKEKISTPDDPKKEPDPKPPVPERT